MGLYRYLPNPFTKPHFYLQLAEDIILSYIFVQVLATCIVVFGILILINYSAYIPGNPKYRPNYDATISVPRNPFTQPPATIKLSVLDQLNSKGITWEMISNMSPEELEKAKANAFKK